MGSGSNGSSAPGEKEQRSRDGGGDAESASYSSHDCFTPTTTPPLVLVHGLLDTPAVFDGLKRELVHGREPMLIPRLPLRLGRTPVAELAHLLGIHIEAAFGREETIDLLGFSMGGVIARTWIQLLGGDRRTRRFISVGSPQQGTITAQPWPGRLFRGLADLKWGSALLRQLNGDLSALRRIECHSFYSVLDLAVLPGWLAVLPVGERTMLPVLTHPQLLRDPAAIKPLARELLRT
ncbi:MAG: esterase/lipase family protein [Cyanobium sp.]